MSMSHVTCVPSSLPTRPASPASGGGHRAEHPPGGRPD